MKIKNKYVIALIMGGIATALANAFSTIVYLILSSLAASFVLRLVVGVATSGGGMMLAAYIWRKIDQLAMKTSTVTLVSIAGAVINSVLVVILPLGGIGFVIDFVVMYVAALFIVMLCAKDGFAADRVMSDGFNVGTSAGGAPQATDFGGMAKQIRPDQIPDGEGLSAAILNAVRGSLKSPFSAVLCNREQMSIIEANGVYTVEGIVHSQNSYGAMIATDFRVQAVYSNGVWGILSCVVGKKAATAYAKSFAKNYIAISIFVGIMALFGTFLTFFIFDIF